MEERSYDKKPDLISESDIAGYGVEVVRSCHICLKPVLNMDFSICEECREAILFAKELKKAVKNIHVKSPKM